MGSYAYLLVAAFIFTGAMILLGQQEDGNRADLDLGRVQMKQEARDAAVSGLNVTIRKMADDVDPWLVADNYDVDLYSYGDRAATYQTVVTIVDTTFGDTVDVVATGTKMYTTRKGVGQDTTHVIEARIARGVLSGATPPGFRTAIVSDQQLLIHGNMSVNALLPGVNADIHTNGDLVTRGNSFSVEGMGTYTGDIRSAHPELFTPPDDWNGALSNVFQRDSIPIPVWDEVGFRSDAQTDGIYLNTPLYVDGDVLAASSVTTIAELAVYLGMDPALVASTGVGTIPDNPLLIMVDNTITFDNAIYLDGYVQFGSNNQIDVITHGSGDGLHMSYDIDIPNQTAATQVGMWTSADIRVEGNATIVATMYAGGSITYLGGTHLIGGQVAHNTTFQGGGTIDIDWVGPGPGVDEYFEPYDEPIGPVIIAYAEW